MNKVKTRIYKLIKLMNDKPFTPTHLRLQARRTGKDIDYFTIIKVLNELEESKVLTKTPKFYEYTLRGELPR